MKAGAGLTQQQEEIWLETEMCGTVLILPKVPALTSLLNVGDFFFIFNSSKFQHVLALWWFLFCFGGEKVGR